MLDMKYCGDPVLRQTAAPVTDITPEIRKQLDDMAEMMAAQRGVGLAAPQVGISKRFIVMRDVRDRADKGVLLKMINPKIVAESDDMVLSEEGCLSVLGPDGPVFADVIRPDAVTVEWTDETGANHKRDFTGYAARIVQHEYDHLDGILFVDHLSSVKREMVMRKVKKGDKSRQKAVSVSD